MSLALDHKRISRAIALLAAAALASSCIPTGKSKTYAPLLEKGSMQEIRQGLEGVMASNSQVIREIGQEPVKGWLRFAVIGDSVSGHNGTYRDLLARVSELDPPPAFVINLGDFTRGRAEHFSYYFETVKGYRLPIIHVMGNHEAEYPGEMIFRTVFGERDFSFDYGDVRFILMGSEKLGFSHQRLDWLEDKLKDPVPAKKIFLSHEFMNEAFTEVFRGIYAHYVHKMRNTDKVLELLRRYDVPLAISGHLHRYYEKTYDGMVMVITGGGGQAEILEPKAREPLSTKEKHFTVFDLPTGPGEKPRVAVSAFDRRGAPLFPASFYQWGTTGTDGEHAMQMVPAEAVKNDPSLPGYLRKLYARSPRKAPAP